MPDGHAVLGADGLPFEKKNVGRRIFYCGRKIIFTCTPHPRATRKNELAPIFGVVEGRGCDRLLAVSCCCGWAGGSCIDVCMLDDADGSGACLAAVPKAVKCKKVARQFS